MLRSGPLNFPSQITLIAAMQNKRESSETPGSVKRAKGENGDVAKPSPSKKKEAVPVPDLEECGFDEEHLQQVS